MGLVLWMLSWNQEAGIAPGLEKKKPLLAYLILICYEGRNPVSAQGAGSLWSPRTWGLLWPVPFSSLMFWLPGFGDYVRSSPFLVPPPLPCPSDLIASHRRIASSWPQTGWSFGYPVAANALSSQFLQPRRIVTDCWPRPPKCLLPNDCYKFWQ